MPLYTTVILTRIPLGYYCDTNQGTTSILLGYYCNYLIAVPAVGDGGLSLLRHHESPHLLEAGVWGNQALERQLIVLTLA